MEAADGGGDRAAGRGGQRGRAPADVQVGLEGHEYDTVLVCMVEHGMLWLGMEMELMFRSMGYGGWGGQGHHPMLALQVRLHSPTGKF